MGTLYIVGTPIGNLGDMTQRAAETLAAVDFIAAEDTRVTAKLLNHLGIKKPMVSCHKFNIRERSGDITGRLLAGESCALVTDAGMPCISDPGEELVALCREQGIPVAVVPGPTAAMSALAVSGLPTGRFAFEGFLSVKKPSRRAHLESLRADTHTLIFYEAPHKLRATLSDLLDAFGDRRIALARELTKIHEEVKLTTLSAAVEEYSTREPKGEYVLILEGAAAQSAAPDTDIDTAARLVAELAASGVSLADAAKQIAKDTGFKKGELYKLALQL